MEIGSDDILIQRIVRNLFNIENEKIIECLATDEPEHLQIDEFDNGKYADIKIRETGIDADTILINPHNDLFRKLSDFQDWKFYGFEYKQRKGEYFEGRLNHFEVFSNPLIKQDEIVVFEKDRMYLNISDIQVQLISEVLLKIEYSLYAWSEIKNGVFHCKLEQL